ncbi:MAG: hypothetical protein ACO1RT_04490 [Planctomycetaceae bacterium]
MNDEASEVFVLLNTETSLACPFPTGKRTSGLAWPQALAATSRPPTVSSPLFSLAAASDHLLTLQRAE